MYVRVGVGEPDRSEFRCWRMRLYVDAAEAGASLSGPRRGGKTPKAPEPERSALEAARRARGQIRRYCASNRLNVDVVPPPAADFSYSPGDPSAIDEVSFSYWNGGYWDPTVTGYEWNFGDGTTATGSPAPHRFAKDGDYTVTITVAARGGRTNSATKTVQVRTHDVTILSLVAPAKGQVGKQGTITVGIGNTRYKETAVQVDLYKVTPQGDVLVGTSIQAVGVMKLKKTVNFTFNYVFTSDDAVLGKVPFKAVATIQGARDAINSDNVATSPPTLVTK